MDLHRKASGDAGFSPPHTKGGDYMKNNSYNHRPVFEKIKDILVISFLILRLVEIAITIYFLTRA